MDAKTLVAQPGSANVSDLVSFGVDRHTARHQFEKLVAEGFAVKHTQSGRVFYTSAKQEAAEAASKASDPNFAPPEIKALLPHIRSGKALSIKAIARRAGVSKTEATLALSIALAYGGLVERPFSRSLRYRLAATQ